jgi:hypothetical protein
MTFSQRYVQSHLRLSREARPAVSGYRRVT